jgi:uncharacterized membrane protein
LIAVTAPLVGAVTFDSTVEFAHVVLAIVAFSFHVAYGLSLAGGEQQAQVLRGIRRLDSLFALPVYALLLVTGVVLVVRGPWDFTTPWVAVGSGLSVVAALVALLVYTPALRAQVDALERGGPRSAGYLAAARKAGWAGGATAVLVVVVAFLMITKPA